METILRRWRVSLIVLGVVVAAISLAAAEVHHWTPPVPPYDISPGIHEEGKYVMRIPGTFGRLWPIRPLFFYKDKEHTDKLDEAGNPQAAALLVMGAGSGAKPVVKEKYAPPSDLGNTALGRFLSSSGGGESSPSQLEDGVRDMMHRLHSR